MKSLKQLSVKWFVLMMSIVVIGTGSALAQSGPFENFFHKLRRALSEPEHKSARRTSRKQIDETKNSANEVSKPTSSTGGGPSAPPNEPTTRSGPGVSGKKGGRLRYDPR